MKGRLIIIVLFILIYIFFHYLNGYKIQQGTQKASVLEATFNAERNINTELKIEHNDLISGRHISSLVPQEMSKYLPKEKAGNVIYIQESEPQQKEQTYCIIDLITPKAEALTTIETD